MKKSQLLEMLKEIKLGNVKIDDAITKAQTSRGTHNWLSVNDGEQLEAGFYYKVDETGQTIKLPLQDSKGRNLHIYYHTDKKA